LNSSKKSVLEDQPAPDRNDEYLLYQTLIGSWPAEPLIAEGLAQFRERIAAYMQKATKEAKVHTSWINPNEEYDAAVRQFIYRLLPGTTEDPFFQELLAFQRRVAYFGYFNSLSQLLLKLTCPGVPDFYQGTELWDFSLVDPDNRRPVDYQKRRQLLAELRNPIDQEAGDLTHLTNEMLADLPKGKIKLFLICQTLNFRGAHNDIFVHGDYLPLEAVGSRRDHVCAFARSAGGEVILVIVPRLTARLSGGLEHPPLGSEIWGQSRLLLPPQLAGRVFRNLFTGEVLAPDSRAHAPDYPLGLLLGRFPVALLWSGEEG
jgi:(1->4)-alpha-D-glucan 1-alpha-D-glucosylmutase